ncbi:MAG: TIGR01212 family radical SAM protein [Nitrospinota bacterium]
MIGVGARYKTFDSHLKETFGEKVYKVSVDGGMTCPNRDGTLSEKGCIYCDEGSHYQQKGVRRLSITEQVTCGIEALRRKRKNLKRFLVYFQAYSGTYSDAPKLKKLWDEALSVSGVVGISVATRPDCLSPDVLALLKEYSTRTYFLVELGIQSMHEISLQRINRGHGVETVHKAVSDLKSIGIKTCAHLILYLPGEGKSEIFETVRVLSGFGVDGVKLHHLHVLKNTPLYDLYLTGNLYLPLVDEYVETVCDVLERLNEETIVHRIVGDAPESRLVAPRWAQNKLDIVNRVHALLEKRGTRQGSALVGS